VSFVKQNMLKILVASDTREFADAVRKWPELLMSVVDATATILAHSALQKFERTVATWEHQPEFRVEKAERNNGVQIMVTTDDRVYTYVDLGTPPHFITPVHAQFLAYPSQFIPKTRPEYLGSFSGGKSGLMTFRAGVYHPGAQARKFSQTIQAEIEQEENEVFEEQFRRALAEMSIWQRVKGFFRSFFRRG